MKIGKTLYVTNRADWRMWLAKHYMREKEVWLIYFKKDSSRARIPYNDAVEEALCFGWIDSQTKGIDEAKYAQRFSPRKNSSSWSEANLERVRRLIKQKKMTSTGLAALRGELDDFKKTAGNIPPDILKAIKEDKLILSNFKNFPDSYKRVRIGWIEGARKRPQEFKKRLSYFLRMTAKGKKFGMVQ